MTYDGKTRHMLALVRVKTVFIIDPHPTIINNTGTSYSKPNPLYKVQRSKGWVGGLNKV
jgi:hypothetical protein